MTNGIHNHLEITICNNAAEAVAKGFDYTKPAEGKRPVKPVVIKNVLVIRKGTQSGNSTVDFLMEDDTGQTFVFMVTGRLLKSIPC